MNTSAKGIDYEWRFRRELLTRSGVKAVLRSSASHGFADLTAITNAVPGGWVDFYECKNTKITCRAASKLTLSLWNRLGMPMNYSISVVHRTKEQEFCEH